ncbi:MAG: cyclodeaminase/cyclohydrolase family protein, partial [Methanobacteriota archaeon]
MTGMTGMGGESVDGLLRRLSAPTPTPGGGSAAAIAGAMAAALVVMVAGLTLGKEKHASVHPRMREVKTEAETLSRSLSEAAEADAAAYDAVVAAHRLPKATPEEAERRKAAVETALRRA